MQADWLVPDWDAPRVRALMTTRHGDQAQLAGVLGALPVFLNQVHGSAVVRLVAADAAPGAVVRTADGSVTTDPRIACAVRVADCLPVLFAAPHGRGVAAAHAGWRGLAGGVLEATVALLCDAAECEAAELQAWLGACIGQHSFEVGADVLAVFGTVPDAADPRCFVAHTPGKWLANLPLLARERLNAAGVSRISGGSWCTALDASRFFSYRRDGSTGRMVAAIRIDPLSRG